MKDIDLDKFWTGVICGLLAPALTFVSYYLINFKNMPVHRFIAHLQFGKTYTSIVTLCLLANLGVFYLFIWREKYNAARGVLGATFIWAAFVMYLKFFTEE
ncbi:MAG: hypothetical protein WBM13_11465 [Bacteroidia bacterium]